MHVFPIQKTLYIHVSNSFLCFFLTCVWYIGDHNPMKMVKYVKNHTFSVILKKGHSGSLKSKR